MISMRVGRATPAEFDVLLPVCLEAFADEAVSVWVEPAPDRRLERTRALFATSLRDAVEAGQLLVAWTDAGEPVAGSIWTELDGAPKAESFGAGEVHEVPEAQEAGAGRAPAAGATRRLAAVLAATSARHPDVPHVYLSAMATLPARRGLGAGSAMLRHGVAVARDRGLPVYLEASTRQNQRLYARHGFRAHGAPLPLPDDGPVLQPMWLASVIHRS